MGALKFFPKVKLPVALPVSSRVVSARQSCVTVTRLGSEKWSRCLGGGAGHGNGGLVRVCPVRRRVGQVRSGTAEAHSPRPHRKASPVSLGPGRPQRLRRPPEAAAAVPATAPTPNLAGRRSSQPRLCSPLLAAAPALSACGAPHAVYKCCSAPCMDLKLQAHRYAAGRPDK